jgi:glucose/arabinose dehydrogenase
VTDGVTVLRAAAGLGTCHVGTCDLDGNGRVGLTDGVAVLRKAAALTAPSSCTFAPPLRLETVASGLDAPLFAVGAPADPSRLFILEQPGRVRVVQDGTLLAEPFLDVTGLTTGSGERGLLGLAFAPDYATSGLFYVHYTDLAGDTVVAEYRRSAGDANRADGGSARPFFRADQPFANHNGGSILFGPDGLLYVALGDGGGGGDPEGNGQDLQSKLGKILRLDPATYPVPPPGNLAGADPDVWDYGLRNPFRASFDRATGDLYIGDVGQGAFEEINVEPAGSGGRNWGWNVTEGFECFGGGTCDTTGISFPAAVLAQRDGNCAVIGGYVYRGNAIPALRGRYLYSDLCARRVFSFVWNGSAATAPAELSPDLESEELISAFASFGEDTAGELYLIDLGGTVYRLVPEEPPAVAHEAGGR